MILIDDKGRKVSLPDEPQRIVSLSPSITETLFKIGKGENIIGVTPFCVRPKEAQKIRKIGSYGYARIDLLKELNPDLILMVSGYQDKLGDELSEYFPVYTIDLPFNLFSIFDLILKTGIVVNRVHESRELVSELYEKLISIERKGRGLRLYYEIDLGGPVTFGSLSYINHGFSFLGFEIYGSMIRKEWFVPDFDDILEFDPEIIIFEPKMFSRASKEKYFEEIAKRKWEGIRAVKEDKIFLTPSQYDFFAHHGPSYIEEALPWASKII